MRQHGALRRAGGAARVHEQRDVRPRVDRGRLAQGFVVWLEIVQQRNAETGCHRGRDWHVATRCQDDTCLRVCYLSGEFWFSRHRITRHGGDT